MTTGPLTGLRIVEISGLGPTPFTAQLMADMGAEVIRIARPGARGAAAHVLGMAVDPLDRGRDVLELLREARTAQIPLTEVSLHFGSLRITARELRGGAIIFLFPQSRRSATPTLSHS